MTKFEQVLWHAVTHLERIQASTPEERLDAAAQLRQMLELVPRDLGQRTDAVERAACILQGDHSKLAADLRQAWAMKCTPLTSTDELDVPTLKEQSEAWFAVCDVLTELAPGWQTKARNGMESAVATIRGLAAPAQGSAPQAERYEHVYGFADAIHVEFPAGSEYGYGVLFDGTKGQVRYTRGDAEVFVRSGWWRKVDAAPVAQEAEQMGGAQADEPKLTVRDGIWWPEGYCRGPNGKIIPPAGKHADFNFGYDVGYGEGLVAHRDSVAAIEKRVQDRIQATPAASSESVDTPELRKLTFEYGKSLHVSGTLPETSKAWAALIAHITSLIEARVAEARKDVERLDCLEGMTVNVRVPLRYGSKDLFWATPVDHGDYHDPSDIRAQIDAAMPASPASGSQEGGAA